MTEPICCSSSRPSPRCRAEPGPRTSPSGSGCCNGGPARPGRPLRCARRPGRGPRPPAPGCRPGPGRPAAGVGRPGRPRGLPRPACARTTGHGLGAAGTPPRGRCLGWRPARPWPARSRSDWSTPAVAGRPPAPGWPTPRWCGPGHRPRSQTHPSQRAHGRSKPAAGCCRDPGSPPAGRRGGSGRSPVRGHAAGRPRRRSGSRPARPADPRWQLPGPGHRPAGRGLHQSPAGPVPAAPWPRRWRPPTAVGCPRGPR